MNMTSDHVPKAVRLNVPSKISNPPSSEKEKMVSGQMYNAFDPELLDGRAYVRLKQREYAQCSPLDPVRQRQLLVEMIGTCGEGTYIEPPVYFDYGSNTHMGAGAYMNYNCVLLDVAPIHIGSRTLLASGVQLLTATHPVDPVTRNSGVEYGVAIHIGDDCWIGGGAIICPGVTIGNGAVVGAGSVVTKNVAPYTVVVGNPARKIRDVARSSDVTAEAAADAAS